MKQKIIMGAGIAGLIYKYYNPESIIIGEEIGGQFNSRIPLGPRYLEKTKETEKFLDDLKIKKNIKKIKILYIDDNSVSTAYTKDFKKAYLLKSRGEKVVAENCSMNGGKSKMDVYEVDFQEIIKKLSECNIINEKIIKVDLNEMEVITKTGAYEYDVLISTIPMPIFCKLADIIPEKPFAAKDLYFYFGEDKNLDAIDFDFAYDASCSPWHRITRIKNGYVYETLNPVVQNGKKLINKISNGQIISKDKIVTENVIFAGRYGAFDRSWKIEKVVREALNERFK